MFVDLVKLDQNCPDLLIMKAYFNFFWVVFIIERVYFENILICKSAFTCLLLLIGYMSSAFSTKNTVKKIYQLTP